MSNLVDIKKTLQKNSVIKRVRELNDGYYVVDTDKTSFLTNGKDLYDINNYPKVNKVMVINNELYIFQYKDFFGTLVCVKGMKEVFNELDVFDVFTNHNSSKYLWLCSSGKSSLLFDIENNRFVNKDLNYKLDFVVSDNLIVYEDFEYGENYRKKTHLYNDKGELLLECGHRIPYYIDGNLVLRVDDDIHIYHDFLGENIKTTILSKNDKVLAKPQIYHENFVIVVDGFIKIINANLEEVKSIPYTTSYYINDTTVEKDYFMMKLKIDDSNFRTVAVSLVHDFVVEHDYMHVLPYWEDDKRRTIVAYDKVPVPDDNTMYGMPDEYTYTLYAEDGTILFKSDQKFIDVDIISKDKDNLYSFVSKDHNYIFDIDTRELKPMPWRSDIRYNDDGHAFCYNTETNLYDVIDEDLNVLFKGVDLKKLKITPQSSPFVFLLNNLICLIESLPYNHYFLLVVDEDGNKYFEGRDAKVDKIGNYIEVVYDDQVVYINSITKECNDSIPSLPDNIGENIEAEEKQIKLNKKNN